jgi:hypothetical protein
MTQALTLQPTLRDAWGSWLGARPWDLFLTLTSDGRTHPEALHKRFRYCVHKISDKLYGREVTRQGTPIEYVNGIERHKSGWPHSHAVLRFPGIDMSDARQFSLAYWQPWISETGGWAWLSVPRDQGEVVGYCCKYVTKDGELVLSESLSPQVERRPQLPFGGQDASAVGVCGRPAAPRPEDGIP